MKPRRSILSVPGHLSRMHEKACASAADVVMLDLEDSVPVDQKLAARRQVIDSIASLPWGDRTLAVRINALDTPFGYRDLLEVAEAAGNRLQTVVIPKVNHPGDLHFASRLLDGIELNLGINEPVKIEVSIETAIGMQDIAAIARASGRVCTLVFGIADYSASVGARLVSVSGHGENEEAIYPGHRWHFPMSRMVMAAKAAGVLAIDAPYGNFKDPDGLRRSAAAACALGFDGKWAIHPDQIGIINEVFAPILEDIARAQKIMEAFDAAEKTGRGAVAVEGRMIDQATVRLARQLLSQARHLKML
jgi:malyl-CoA/(S)-citramalyl-CoA lyase